MRLAAKSVQLLCVVCARTTQQWKAPYVALAAQAQIECRLTGTDKAQQNTGRQRDEGGASARALLRTRTDTRSQMVPAQTPAHQQHKNQPAVPSSTQAEGATHLCTGAPCRMPAARSRRRSVCTHSGPAGSQNDTHAVLPRAGPATYTKAHLLLPLRPALAPAPPCAMHAHNCGRHHSKHRSRDGESLKAGVRRQGLDASQCRPWGSQCRQANPH